MRSFVLARVLASFLLALTVSCGPAPEGDPANVVVTEESQAASSPSDTPEAAAAAAPAESPEEVVRQFIEAGNIPDHETMLALMTVKAREVMSSGDAMGAGGFESYTVGEAVIAGDLADVPVEATQFGETQALTMKLRLEENAWRVYGVHVEADGLAITVNFEDIEGMLQEMTQQMGDALASGMQDAFSGLTGGATGEDLAAKKASFEALAPVTMSDYERMWKNSEDFKGQPTLDAVTALADVLGLGVDAGEHADALAKAVDLDVAGMPRAEAIERLSNAAGLYAIFPDPDTDWGAFGDMAQAMADGLTEVLTDTLPEGAVPPEDASAAAETPARPAIMFASGERLYPVQFAGPFVFSIDDVSTEAPNPIGTAWLSVRAYGLSPAIQEALSADMDSVVLDRVTGPDGTSLIPEGLSYLSGGESDGLIYHDAFNVNLLGLIRSVTHVAEFSGTQELQLPEEVADVRFEVIEEGQAQSAGDFEVLIESVSENYTQFRITGPDEKVGRLNARFWAMNADGVDVDVMMESTDKWEEGAAYATAQTYEAHAALDLKLVTLSEPQVYSFAFTNIPVPGHEQMPEKIEELSFEGHETPLTAEFVRFLEAEDPAFREVLLNITNHSNKTATDAFGTFYYLDETGTELDDFPSNLTGDFGADGFLPVAEAGATTELTATAFSAPETTASIRVVIEQVNFSDGTSWSADNW